MKRVLGPGSLSDKDPGLPRADNLGKCESCFQAPEPDKISRKDGLHGNRKFVS